MARVRYFAEKTAENSEKNHKKQDLGTWKPDGQLGECGFSIIKTNIFGGNVTKLGEIPYMALLGYKEPSGKIGYLCGGSVINKWYILTAAHCVNRDNWSGIPV